MYIPKMKIVSGKGGNVIIRSRRTSGSEAWDLAGIGMSTALDRVLGGHGWCLQQL